MSTPSYYPDRSAVEEALAGLPGTAEIGFLQEIRAVIERTRDPETVLGQICADLNCARAVRFAALYGVLLRLRREERLTEYADLIARHEEEFGTEPYFHTFRAVVLRLEGGLAELTQAVNHAREAARLLADVPGVQHQVAELLAEYLERLESTPDPAELAAAEHRVDRAISLSHGRIAHYWASCSW